MIEIWKLEYDKIIQTKTMPKCVRSIYKTTLTTKELDYGSSELKLRLENHGLSELKIRLENPNVLTIVDSYSYDIQSFVGEVGGTLGLFLGLSVFSFVEFAEYLLRKMYSERPEGI